MDKPTNDRQGNPESAAEFRAFLAEIGETQSGFARTLKRMGDDRGLATILRHVQRMATGEARISGEMRVIMSVFRNSRSRRYKWMVGHQHGTAWIPLPLSPQFDDYATAEQWARKLLTEQPGIIQPGLEGITVGRVRVSGGRLPEAPEADGDPTEIPDA